MFLLRSLSRFGWIQTETLRTFAAAKEIAQRKNIVFDNHRNEHGSRVVDKRWECYNQKEQSILEQTYSLENITRIAL